MPNTDPITVYAEWDDEAEVWSIRSDDVPGLCIEADHFDQIGQKARVAIADLAEFEPSIAALAGRPLDIHTIWHEGQLAFA